MSIDEPKRPGDKFSSLIYLSVDHFLTWHTYISLGFSSEGARMISDQSQRKEDAGN